MEPEQKTIAPITAADVAREIMKSQQADKEPLTSIFLSLLSAQSNKVYSIVAVMTHYKAWHQTLNLVLNLTMDRQAAGPSWGLSVEVDLRSLMLKPGQCPYLRLNFLRASVML